MPKAGKIGVWITVAGIALVAQGCWDEQPAGLTFLGDGGCRVADGGEGEPTTIVVASSEECQAQCFGGDTACAAVEYNANNSQCEVHREQITKFEKVDGVTCYVMK